MINEEKAQAAIEMLIILAGLIALAIIISVWVWGTAGNVRDDANTATNNTINAINQL